MVPTGTGYWITMDSLDKINALAASVNAIIISATAMIVAITAMVVTVKTAFLAAKNKSHSIEISKRLDDATRRQDRQDGHIVAIAAKLPSTGLADPSQGISGNGSDGPIDRGSV